MSSACRSCHAQPVAGAFYPLTRGEDALTTYVVRCDACELYDTDREAAAAVAAQLRGLLLFGIVHNDGAEVLAPLVMAAAVRWCEECERWCDPREQYAGHAPDCLSGIPF